MGVANQKESKEDKKSNSSVLNLSLGSINSFLSDSSSSNSNNKNKIKNKNIIPSENKNIEWQEFLLEGKEEEIKQKLFIEEDNNYNFFQNGLTRRKRSKTYDANTLIKKAPKPHLKIPDEYISPLKLNVKNFGIFPKWIKRPNAILYDFQKNLIECKSCNDEENIDDEFFLCNSETERTTPNLEDLQNLLNCRKIMTIFRNSINDRTIKEYENILNSDYIFVKKESNNSNQHHKKNKFWHKHIRQQQLKYSNQIFSSNLPRLSSDVNDVKRAETTINTENTKDHGLFILGILESAANERKGRNTVNV